MHLESNNSIITTLFENFIKNQSKKYNFMTLGGKDDYFTSHIKIKKLDSGFYALYSQINEDYPVQEKFIYSSSSILHSLELEFPIRENNRVYFSEDSNFKFIEFKSLNCPFCNHPINHPSSDSYSSCEHFIYEFIWEENNFNPSKIDYAISRTADHLLNYDFDIDINELIKKYKESGFPIERFILNKSSKYYFEELIYVKDKTHFRNFVFQYFFNYFFMLNHNVV